MKIRKNDMVVVISGDDASTNPRRVLQVFGSEGKVLVEGVNQVYKHVRRGHPRSPQGGRLHLEMPIDLSNVQLYCDSCSAGVRTGYRTAGDGGKERFCKKCGGGLGVVTTAKKKQAEVK